MIGTPCTLTVAGLSPGKRAVPNGYTFDLVADLPRRRTYVVLYPHLSRHNHELGGVDAYMDGYDWHIVRTHGGEQIQVEYQFVIQV